MGIILPFSLWFLQAWLWEIKLFYYSGLTSTHLLHGHQKSVVVAVTQSVCHGWSLSLWVKRQRLWPVKHPLDYWITVTVCGSCTQPSPVWPLWVKKRQCLEEPVLFWGCFQRPSLEPISLMPNYLHSISFCIKYLE